MYRYIYAALLVILFVLLYKILEIVFSVEDTKVKRKYTNASIKRQQKPRPDFMFQKYIILPEYRKMEMKEQLFSLNVSMTPEQYVSSYVYKGFIPLLIAFGVFIIGFREVSAGIGIYAVYSFFRSKNKLQRALDFRRTKIEEEAPDLIRFFLVSLRNNANIKDILRSYKEIAKYMKRDIELCIIDMESIQSREDNLIYALEKLDDRLNTPIMTDFVSGLINQSLGKNQESFFMILEKDLKDLSLNNLFRKARKVEGQIRPSFYLIIATYILLTMSMMVVFVASNLI